MGAAFLFGLAGLAGLRGRRRRVTIELGLYLLATHATHALDKCEFWVDAFCAHPAMGMGIKKGPGAAAIGPSQ